MSACLAHLASQLSFGASTLQGRLARAFAAMGRELVACYRHGPYKIEILYKDATKPHYWSSTSKVDKTQPWTQADLDAELERLVLSDLDEHIHGVD